MIIMIVLICIVGLYVIKLNGNAEIIRDNCKTDSDAVNIKNGQKVFYKSRAARILLIAFVLTLVMCLVFNFTNIGNLIIDYFSYDIYEAKKFDYSFYYIPAYIFVIRELIVQVSIGDFLYKYFKIEEPELEGNSLMALLTSILYKKKPTDDKRVDDENKK